MGVRIKLLDARITRVRLKPPLFMVLRSLVAHNGEEFVFDPEEAIHIVYKAVRLGETRHELYSVEIEREVLPRS